MHFSSSSTGMEIELKKLLDNLRQSPYNRTVGVLGLKFIFNLVLSDKSTV
ncbi:MAG: hypothetical protein ACR5K9_04205 [Wolbachia sp.]